MGMNNQSADIVLCGGRVYTSNPDYPSAEAVAVRNNLIVAVGTADDIRPYIGPSTNIINLDSKMLVPGFQDAHIHPIEGGLERLRCTLSQAHSRVDYYKIIHDYAIANPHVNWILGGGWSMDVFEGTSPTAVEIDKVVPDRPVFLPNRDHHSAWVNSKALEMAGIDPSTSDPPDGRIERDQAGNPTGTLHEGAMHLVDRLIPPPSQQDLVAAALDAQEYLHSLGITGWQDAIVVPGGSLETYCSLANENRLTARIVGALWWDRDRGEEQLDQLIKAREKSHYEMFRATTVKIMLDGVCETYTAAMLEPYLDSEGRATANYGLMFLEPSSLEQYVVLLDSTGFQVHVHAIGDRAIRHALDAFEAALLKNGPTDNRHHIAHIQVINPSDLARFGALNVTGNGQPLWACLDPQMVDLTIPFLGPERSSYQYPFRSLLDAGARMGFGSDWPVSSPNPLWGIHVAVNRTVPPNYPYASADTAEHEAFLADERIDLDRALHAFTMGSAYINHLDDVTGSIEVGKFADLVVLDRDLVDHDPGSVSEARVLLTMVNGRVMFEVEGL